MPIFCPRCSCTSCETNHFENVPFDEVASGALTAKRAGKPAHALSLLAVWSGVEVLNWFRPKHRCTYCGHTFDAALV